MTKEQVTLAWFLDNDNLLCPECKPEYTEEEENAAALKFFEASATEARKEEAKNEPPPTLSPPTSNPKSLSVMINEDELSLVNRYGLEEEYVDEIRCDLCECWFDEVEEAFCSDNNKEFL